MKLSPAASLFLMTAIGTTLSNNVVQAEKTGLKIKITSGDICDANHKASTKVSNPYFKVYIHDAAEAHRKLCGTTTKKQDILQPVWNDIADCGNMDIDRVGGIRVYVEAHDDAIDPNQPLGQGTDGVLYHSNNKGYTKGSMTADLGSECGESTFNYEILIGPEPPKDPTTYGDPHFRTWSGKMYDFHGGCDLVLLQNPGFANGLGMNIHIRTSIRTWWSFIESAVIQIGDNTLQVTGGIGSSSVSLNGANPTELITGDTSLGDYPVHFRRVNDHHTIARIDIGHGDAIGIETFKDFVRVNIKNKSNKSFKGSSGLYGSYPDGAMIARDGMTVMEDDPNEFGQEWMVGSSDRILFQDVDATKLPTHCVMPNEITKKEAARRRLGESAISEEAAALACAGVKEEDRDACIFDVMATQDKDMVGSY